MLRRHRKPKLKPALRKYHDPGKPYKWAVYYRGEDGKRARRKFVLKQDAQEFFDDKIAEAENLGAHVASALGDDLKRQAVEAQALLRPFGKTILDAASFYEAHLKATLDSEPLSALRDRFLATKKAEGVAARTLGDLKNRLDGFLVGRESAVAATITTKEIEDWLLSLKVAMLTRRHYKRVIHSFFAWTERQGYSPSNPARRLPKIKIVPHAPPIYTPQEMRTILRAALDWKPDRIKRGLKGTKRKSTTTFEHETRDVLANIVVCGFAGLRQAEFERLTWEQIKSDRGVIDLGAIMTKTAARRIVTIRPVLQTWLSSLSPAGKGSVRQTNWGDRIRKFREHLRTQHGLTWKHNALRHSFASYLWEETHDLKEVATQLGNTPGIVERHYKELVTADAAKTYWALTPAETRKDESK